jgi:methionyl-tRNA formyltransferase
MARVVFMGTPEFAVPSLEALDEVHQVVGVVTQPDRPAGRGRQVLSPPVKEAALARNLEILQPRTLRAAGVVEQLADWQPEVIVVAAFGQILRPEVLSLPSHGCLNVHASLLPRYRGAAPIPAAILAGEQKTGVTVMLMDEGLDTGPILAQAELPIGSGDTSATLTARLSVLGASLLIETLPAWLAGEIRPRPQDESQATWCRTLRKEDGRLDWAQSATYLDRQVRASDPWPGAYTTWHGRRLKVLRTQPWPDWSGPGQVGQAVALGEGIGVVTGQGALELVEVQLAGKKPMSAGAFLRGQRDLLGDVLGKQGEKQSPA